MAKAKPKKKKKTATPKTKKRAPEPKRDIIRVEAETKFWQAELAGKRLIVTFGKLGADGQEQKTTYKDEWEAKRDREKQVIAKQRKGYAYPAPAPPAPVTPARNAQLEQQLAKDAGDASLAVYADWLQEQGDVRGELAVLQQRVAKKPKDKKLQNAERKLRWDYRGYFYGPLAAFVRDDRKKLADWDASPVVATWRHGWIDTLVLGACDWHLPLDRTADLIALVPQVASARFVRDLVIARPVFADAFNFTDAVAATAKILPSLPALRRLTIGEFSYEDSELSWSELGKLDKLWPVAQQLEYLKLRGGSMTIGEIELPNLRELEIETGGLKLPNLHAITNQSWPELERLVIWFGEKEYGCTCKATDVVPILDGKAFPKLRHVALKNTQWGDELAALVCDSKILRRLETLDVSMSHLTGTGIAVYTAHAKALAHLKALDVERCLLDKPAQRAAKQLGKFVAIGDSQEAWPDWAGDDWRYAAVGE